MAVAEELPPHVHVHAIASPPLNARTNKRVNAKLFRTLIITASPFLPSTIGSSWNGHSAVWIRGYSDGPARACVAEPSAAHLAGPAWVQSPAPVGVFFRRRGPFFSRGGALKCEIICQKLTLFSQFLRIAWLVVTSALPLFDGLSRNPTAPFQFLFSDPSCSDRPPPRARTKQVSKRKRRRIGLLGIGSRRCV